MSWQSVIERTVLGLGYDLVDVERSAQGLLRVFIDRLANDPRGEFITVNDCEIVTRQLQRVLEVEAASAYERLEVSSPGVDRPLNRPAHYARFVGQEIELQLKQPFEGRRKFKGKLQAQALESHAEGGDQAWSLEFMDGAQAKRLNFLLDEVREARLVPVLDFKGRRFQAEPEIELLGEPADDALADDQEDGGVKE